MIDLGLIGKQCGPIPFEYTWKDKDGRYLIRSRTDRGVVLSHAYAGIA